MYKIKGTYDGERFSFENPLPKGKFNVELRLSKIKEEMNEEKINKILEFSGIWNDIDTKIFDDINRRKNFSKSIEEYDIYRY